MSPNRYWSILDVCERAADVFKTTELYDCLLLKNNKVIGQYFVSIWDKFKESTGWKALDL